MAVCDFFISRDISVNCDEPMTPGIEAEGIIMNRSDIDFALSKINDLRSSVIESIVLKAKKKAYRIVQMGGTPFTGTNEALATGTYINTFNKVVNFVVLDNGPDVCDDIIDGLANGSFVVILENNHKAMQKSENAGDAAYQVYGWHNGLKATEISNDKYSEDTNGGWLISLQETKAPKSGMFLYKESYETTREMIDALTAETGE